MSGLLIEVAFKGNRKEFFLWEGESPPPLRAPVIVDADRGEDLGRVHATGDLAARRCAGCGHGSAAETPSRKARRLATDEDVRRAEELRAQDEDARRKAMERVRANDLTMKLSDAEWQWDRKKLTFYFTAEKRVDFRTLVRELASMFRTRIELKQIGVRDEARRLDGIGRCGRQYCSASWLPELRPVNLGVAKDQRLSLNPSQISGACGRLMCCLRYEHDFYVQSRKRFPKEGRLVRTARGEEKVIANDIFRERVTLRGEDGEFRIVPLADLRRELAEAAEAADAASRGEPAPAGESSGTGAAAEGVAESSSGATPPRGASATAPRGAPASPSGGSVAASGRSAPTGPSNHAGHGGDPTGGAGVPGNERDDRQSSGAEDDDGTRDRRTGRRRGRRGGRRSRGGGSGPGLPPAGE